MQRRLFLASFSALPIVGLAQPLSARSLAGGGPLLVFNAYLAAWNVHDSTAAAVHFDEDVVYYDASVGTPIKGRSAAKAGVVDNFLNAAPDAVWAVNGPTMVQQNKLSFEWTFSGTNTGNWADGTKATGKPFKFTGATFFFIADGKIKSQSDYYDALGFYKQLGLI